MKLYVWDCLGFECGLYVALARSVDEARAMFDDKYGDMPHMVRMEPDIHDIDTPVAFGHGCCQG
jgi:hypothetical protein